jgi:DNA topoisomerase VI subunit A
VERKKEKYVVPKRKKENMRGKNKKRKKIGKERENERELLFAGRKRPLE